jgi:hypothetical protein
MDYQVELMTRRSQVQILVEFIACICRYVTYDYYYCYFPFWKNLLFKYIFCVQSVRDNLKVSHGCHICNGCPVTISDIEFTGMFTMYLNARLHMPNSNGSIIITIKPKAKYIFYEYAATMSLALHSLVKKKWHIFWRSVTIRHFMTIFQ